jgi:CheY-like chemotaxis protein
MARILLATSDAALSAALEATLEGAGYGVHALDTGIDVLETALAEAPDLVLLDHALAVRDGLETTDLLRADPEIPRELPILLLADDAPPSPVLERHGVSAVLPKRLDAALLLERVVSWLMRNPNFRG